MGSTWLSPGSGCPLAVPRRTSARRKNETAVGELFVTVTLVAVSSPPAPALARVLATAFTLAWGRPWSAWRLAHCGWPGVSGADHACGLPWLSFLSTTSCWVDNQLTLRSTTPPF